MKKTVILGAGESGLGAALLALSQGHKVFVSDAGNIAQDRKRLLTDHGIPFEEKAHSWEQLSDADTVVKSPGIPFSLPLIANLVTKGIPVIDELEFSATYSRGKVIAITGTNGKTTTTLLTYHLLKSAGLDVGLAGNVGKSWAGQLVAGDHDWWVIEVSSFQIEGFKTLKPKIAVLLNITPDHLDRYGYEIANYAAAKFKLLDNMDESDHLIYFSEQEIIREHVDKTSRRFNQYPVAWSNALSPTLFAEDNALHIEWAGKTIYIQDSETTLRGEHNKINSLCAIQAALLAGVTEPQIRDALKSFVNAAHRMEDVGTVSGIRFINDSKGTNVDATKYALEAYKEPLIWIAGGVDKGNDYQVLFPLVENHVKHLICLGKDNEKLKAAFKGIIPSISETVSLKEAVEIALDRGDPGDVTLLSPACASFDLFKNYEDRGDQFRIEVKHLKERITS